MNAIQANGFMHVTTPPPPQMKISVLPAVIMALATAASLPAQTKSPRTSSGPEIQESDIVALDVFSVSAEESSGYGVSTSTSATKLAMPIKDIPQSINIVTADFLKDTFAVNLSDAVKYVPNVSKRAMHVVNALLVRGFIVQNHFQDGFRVLPSDADLSNIDRIEIIKGPASATTGRGEAGGAVNYVTKHALSNRKLEVSTTFGSFNFYRAVADATGPLNEQKNLRYRFIAAYQDNDTYKPFEHIRKLSFFPRFEWDLSENTQVTVSSTISSIKTPGQSAGLFITSRTSGNPAGLVDQFTKREAFLGEKWEGREINLNWSMATITHRFNDVFTARQGLQFGSSSTLSYWAVPNPRVSLQAGTGNLLINRDYREFKNTDTQYYAVGDLVAQYSFLGGNHSTLIGYEYGQLRGNSLTMLSPLAPINYTNPVYGARPTAISLSNVFERTTRTLGFPVQQQSSFFNGMIKVMAGVRFDNAEAVTDYSYSPGGLTVVKNPWDKYTASDRYGITFSPREWISFYAVQSSDAAPTETINKYNVTFDAGDPRNGQTITGARTGELKEYGLKAELLGGRLSATVSVFDMKRSGQALNITRIDPQSGRVYSELFFSEGEISKGVEVQLFGSLTKQIEFIASYADTQTSNQISTGKVYISSVPAYEFSAFVKYSFNKHGKDGFSARIGYIKFGEMWGATENLFKVPEQSKMDVGVSYKYGRFNFDLQVNNVLDDRFIEAAPLVNVLAETFPRQVFGSVTYAF
jgi:iron complex outermembrane receptor protein